MHRRYCLLLVAVAVVAAVAVSATSTNQRRRPPVHSSIEEFDTRIAIAPEPFEAVYHDCPNEHEHRRPLLHRNTRNIVAKLLSGNLLQTTKRGVAAAAAAAAVAADNWFVVSYATSVPAAVQRAMQEATELWSEILEDVLVPIHVSLSWSSTSLSSNTLGAAGPSFVYLNGADQLYYCDAQINQIAGRDVDPSTADIVVTLNSQFAGWHYDTEVPPPAGRHDLLTVLLHELFHGLGMIGLVSTNGLYLTPDATCVYDRFLVDGLGEPIVTAESRASSSLLLERVTSNAVYFRVNGPRLYAPASFSAGSSLYHFDEATYAPGSHLALMTPSLNSQERLLDIGSIGYGVLDTIGWPVRNCTEYSSNCHVCTLASCLWCSSSLRCVPSASYCTDGGGGDVVEENYQCSECESDQECDDLQDQCRTGSCVGSVCVYEAVVCDDGRSCTTSLCDSATGCLHVDVDGECHLEDRCGALRDRDLWIGSSLPAVNSGLGHYPLLSSQGVPASAIERATVYMSIEVTGGPASAQVQCGGGSHHHNIQLFDERSLLRPGTYTVLFDDEAESSILAVPSSPSLSSYRPIESLVEAFYGRTLDGSCTLALRGNVTLHAVELRLETEDRLAAEQSLTAYEGNACALCAERDLVLTGNLEYEAQWSIGRDIPALPEDFFGRGSEAIDDNRSVAFTWCGEHVQIEHTSDVLLRPSQGQEELYVGRVRDFRLCSLRPLTVRYANGTEEELWTVEAQVAAEPQSRRSHASVAMTAASCYQGVAEVELAARMSFTFYNDNDSMRNVGPGTLLDLFYHPSMQWRRRRSGSSHRLVFFVVNN